MLGFVFVVAVYKNKLLLWQTQQFQLNFLLKVIRNSVMIKSQYSTAVRVVPANSTPCTQTITPNFALHHIILINHCKIIDLTMGQQQREENKMAFMI